MEATEVTILNVLNGKTDQFEKLISENNELLYRIGMSYINSHSDVEDLMQSTYLKAFEKLNTFNNKSTFSTWLTRIMINECLMFLRSKKVKREIYLDDDVSNELSELFTNETAENILNYKELKDISEKIILKLPEEYRIVFMLRQVQRLPVRDVADMLNISEQNVKVRIFRSRRMIQKMLLNYMGENEVFSYDKKYCTVLTHNVMSKLMQRNL